ncbi:MAG TPA: 50S ribosomal protein L3 [Erysipelothrix sp.]|nr:50S ribosomal protein L3 [Erysipelothrix sp.]
MKGLIGRKLGMTQVFLTDGKLVPVTVVEVLPNVVLQKKTNETDGYEAVQLGVVDVKENKATQAQKGHADKANTTSKKFVREFKGEEMLNLEVGDEVKADLFEAGEKVDVRGRSRGKGYMGAIYRNNQAIGPRSHGSGAHRTPGSFANIGVNSATIKPGLIKAGQEGYKMRTNQNLEIVKVDAENNYLLIKGNVPGPKRGVVTISTTVKSTKKVDAVELVDLVAQEV